MNKRLNLILIALAVLLLAAPGWAAKSKIVPHDDPDAIADQWIVLVDKEGNVDKVIESLGAEPLYVYRLSGRGEGIQGFAAKLDVNQLARGEEMAEVMLIEQDGRVSTQEVQQSGATWGLDRVDQRYLPLTGDYWYYLDANVSPFTSGTTTHIYTIDTGINYTHVDFAGRVSAAPGQFFDAFGGTGADCHGHGSHVSGTAAGTTWGVAKDATLHSVRVLGCGGFGTWGGVIAGVNWVTANHVKPAVANMSLGGGFNGAANMAVDASVAAGVFYAVAAGNSNANACLFSPASAAGAYTAGATTQTDTRAFFSNFGTCVDNFAPGVAITSAWIGSPTATNTIQGTSMASPHIAGSAALYLSIYPWAPPGQVRAALDLQSTVGVVINPGVGSPNLLLHSKAHSLESAYSGSVAGFQSAIEPMGVPYYTPTSGLHEGFLSNAAGSNLTLRLRKFNPTLGTSAVVATATGSPAQIRHHDGPGTYSWEVFNPAAPGTPSVAYTFLMSQP